jgi:hypothetical protein
MKTYETVTEAVQDLQRRGYTENFNLQKDLLLCDEREIFLHPRDFEVDEVYRFEGNSDPGDENTVYAISSGKHKLKGILVSAYGAYADISSTELLDKLHYKH